MPLTPLRAAGLAFALVFAVLAIRAYRQGKIGNGDLLLRLGVFVLPLLVLSAAPGILTTGLDELSFKRGGGRQVVGATVIAVGVLFIFAYLLSGRQDRTRRDLTRLIENLALRDFLETGHPEQFAGGIAIVIPAYNESSNIAPVIGALPERICGLELHAIVVDDGSADDTTGAGPAGRRVGGLAAAQPRPGRRAAHRLPAGAGDRRRGGRDDGCRRAAPAVGAVAAGQADRGRRGGRGRRLAGAGPGGQERGRARAGDQGVRAAAVAAHVEPRHRPGVRLPRRAHRGAARTWSSARISSTTPSSSSRRRRSTCARSRCRSPSRSASPGRARSRPTSATGSASPTRSSAPGCADAPSRAWLGAWLVAYGSGTSSQSRFGCTGRSAHVRQGPDPLSHLSDALTLEAISSLAPQGFVGENLRDD